MKFKVLNFEDGQIKEEVSKWINKFHARSKSSLKELDEIVSGWETVTFTKTPKDIVLKVEGKRK